MWLLDQFTHFRQTSFLILLLRRIKKLLEILHPNRCTLTLSQPIYSVFGCCKHICRLFTKLPSEGALDVDKFCSAEKGDVWLTLDGAWVHIKVALH